jgi:hypothetical protein
MPRFAPTVWLASLIVFALPCASVAQSAEELAKQTQNPVSSLISFPFQANWDVGIGDREATGTTLNIQPVAPFSLVKDWNVILRVVMPLVSQPADAGPRINGMGDTIATAFLAPARTGRIIWGAGPALLLPTATNNLLGSEQVGIGPSVGPSRSPDAGPWASCGIRSGRLAAPTIATT